ncbi:MAG TPA: alanine racemase [Allosphingosinicella sp.]|nr:alanine racemase [Allosphingosinicella sp.]
MVHNPLRLRIDGDALVSNWHWLAHRSGGAECGAAVKANGYGLGARQAVKRLQGAGCRAFFVATWAEAELLAPWPGDLELSVLHGAMPQDMAAAKRLPARPVLNSAEQVARWRGTGRPCDVMIDTGINRLGVSPGEVADGLLDGLRIETLMSHLACADEDSPVNKAQLEAFRAIAGKVDARRLSLANSAGICLGADYAFGLTRPGLALYGGVPRREAQGHIRQVAHVEAQVVQRRRVEAGGKVGYGGTFTADEECELLILNLGYADGYLRGFSSRGRAKVAGQWAPVAGRVSMDLTAIRIDPKAEVGEGDWVELDYSLPEAAVQSGLSQYELLTTLGSRFKRFWS